MRKYMAHPLNSSDINFSRIYILPGQAVEKGGTEKPFGYRCFARRHPDNNAPVRTVNNIKHSGGDFHGSLHVPLALPHLPTFHSPFPSPHSCASFLVWNFRLISFSMFIRSFWKERFAGRIWPGPEQDLQKGHAT